MAYTRVLHGARARYCLDIIDIDPDILLSRSRDDSSEACFRMRLIKTRAERGRPGTEAIIECLEITKPDLALHNHLDLFLYHHLKELDWMPTVQQVTILIVLLMEVRFSYKPL